MRKFSKPIRLGADVACVTKPWPVVAEPPGTHLPICSVLQRWLSRLVLLLWMPWSRFYATAGRGFVICLAAIAVGHESVPAKADKPPAFTEVCFEDFELGGHYSTADDLKKLLKPVRGRISDYRYRNIAMGQLSGVFRLIPAWQPDSALRLMVHDQKDVKLHFWKGRQGVTLARHKGKGDVWAAYGTTRKGNQPTSTIDALWATSGARYERAGTGAVEVRCQGKHLVLTRGDLVLLTAPFRGTPDEVYLEGESAKIIGMELIRSGPAPLPQVSRPVVCRIDRPADIEWKTDLWEESKVNKLADGRIELVIEKMNKKDFYQRKKLRRDPNAPVSQAGIDTGEPELVEFIFELEDPEHGTGIYLADEKGRHLQWISFCGEKSTGKTVYDTMAPKSYIGQRGRYNDRSVVRLAGRRQWLRIIAAGGTMRYWISGDGEHWSPADYEDTTLERSFSEIGIYCFPDEREPRSIRLKSLVIRRLDRLESLVPGAVKRQVPSMGDVGSEKQWKERVAESRPPDVPEKVWRWACTLRSLAENVPRHVSQPLLLDLMRDVVDEPGDPTEKFALLDEASLLIPTTYQSQETRLDPAGAVYQRLGEQLHRQGHPAPFTLTRRALLNRPGRAVAAPVLADLLWFEMLTQVQSQHWAKVDAMCRRTKFWLQLPSNASYERKELYERRMDRWRERHVHVTNQMAVAHMLNWGEAVSRVRLAEPTAGKPPTLGKQWQHPLVTEISKESYNVLGEFKAALASGAYRDACQILTAAAASHPGDLLPDTKDKRLLVSMPQIVRLAMDDNPALRRTMQAEFGPQGKLRVGRAIAENDPAAVEAATLQFLGTGAAADAHRWLGNRALSGGEFIRAMNHYRRALADAPDALRGELLALLRLAGAMLDKDIGEPVTRTVTIGELVLSPREFETLVEQARRAARGFRADRSSGGNGAMDAFGRPPPPRAYELREWARLVVDLDRRVHRIPREGLWAARSTAVDIADGKMIVNSQIQQAAFELKSGRQVWRQRETFGGKQPLHWSAAPLQPAVDRDRIFVRRSAENGFELACLNVRDGKLLWSSRPTAGKRGGKNDFHGATSVISDPIPDGRKLLALTATDEPAEQCVVEFTQFDADTGRILRRVPLARFQNCPPGGLSAQVAVEGDQVVATVGGAVLCCDLFGRVRWARRQPWIPSPGATYGNSPWPKQIHRKPVVTGGRVYATQPGFWGIECIELDTGRLFWRTGMPELTSLVGRLGELLIAETTDGLIAIEPHWSCVVWRHDIENRLETRLCADKNALCYARLEASNDRETPAGVMLVWIDPKTGRLKDRMSVGLSDKVKDPLLGPLAVEGNRHWVFLSTDDRGANQEIMELIQGK